jgi:hypothetical protein
MIWCFERDEHENQRNHKIDSQKAMIPIFWEVDGFHLIGSSDVEKGPDMGLSQSPQIT